MRSRLLFNALQEQPRVLRHAPLPNIQKFSNAFLQRCILRAVFLTIYFCYGLLCAVFLTIYFLQRFILRSFLTIYFDFDYTFLYI